MSRRDLGWYWHGLIGFAPQSIWCGVAWEEELARWLVLLVAALWTVAVGTFGLLRERRQAGGSFSRMSAHKWREGVAWSAGAIVGAWPLLLWL